jgi:P4 family phage/plasmid primase-like protien
MVKIDIDKLIDNGIAGEKTINPGYKNPEIASHIAGSWIAKGYPEQEIEKLIFNYFGMKDLANKILEIQPLYFDKAKNWWIWNFNSSCWEIIDETDILNMVSRLSTANTIKSKEKNEIIEALKQAARIKKPKEIKRTWIQFEKTIYDIETGETFEATPEYFVTNPLPWKLHPDKFIETPNMDRIFEEWVGKDYIKTLYEIIAYCLLPDYPIHRLFCLIGIGLNGKSCFLRLLKKFVGIKNVCSTELDVLLVSRFETTKLYKKLVCLMGETNFAEISQTSIIKKLTGQDTIGFEFKNKDLFDDYNYAKIIIATNNLPESTDKTIGFYRRWCIIDFPNKFSEDKDILKDIPDEEYEALALKSVYMLKDLLETRKFTNEGTLEERQKKYEDKSDPITKFIKEQVILDVEGNVNKSDFEQKLNNWCKANRFRTISEVAINKKMKELGIFEGRVRKEWYEDKELVERQVRVWLNVKWRYGE